ncbi:MAG: hypothetical protein HY367_04665 [Candidatus Aenigmarchaeota archaeon]|nr:hypothetical protein [Candidatus Aenigmarchaeota archaeon]
MDHKERMDVAEKIVKKVLEKYGNKILVGGLCGSTARDEDLPHSDIEMLFITKEGSRIEGNDFLFKDIQVAVAFTDLKDAEKMLSDVDHYWAMRIARFFCIKKMCGDGRVLERFHDAVRAIPDGKFTRELKEDIPPLADLLNKIRNARLEKDQPSAIDYARSLLYHINLCLGLLNRRHFTRNYYKNFIEAFGFKKLPKDYEKLVKRLWISQDPDEIARLSEGLAGNYLALLEENKISIKTYNSVDEVGL